MPTAARWIPAVLFIVLPGLLVVPGFKSGHFLLGTDMIGGYYHLRGAVGRALAEGRLPVWDPHNMCGAPLHAAMHGGVLYPLTWPAMVLSPGLFWTLTVWVHLSLAGAFAFLWLARGLGFSRWSALTGALLFMLSGFLAFHVYQGNIAHVSAVPWAAAVMWRLERFLAQPKLQRGLLLAAVLAVMILVGFPQFVYILGFAIAARLGQFVLAEREGRVARARVAAQAVGSLALSCVLAAPQLLPTIELTGEGQRSALKSFEFASSFSVAPKHLATLVAPLAFGPSREIPDGCSGFIGFVGFGLAVFGALARSPQRWLWVGLALFGLVLALGHHTPFFKAFFYVVPGASLFRVPARYLMLFTLASAPLAAMGLDRLMGRGRIFAAAAGVLLVAELAGFNARYFEAYPLEGMEWSADFVSWVKKHPQYPFRIATVSAEQTPSIGKCRLAGIDHVGGYDPMMLRRYTEICNVARDKPATDPIVAMVLARPSPLFDLLGARVWIVPGPQQAPPGWKTVAQLDSGFVYENPRALPRAFLVGRSVVIDSPEERLQFMKGPSFDPRRTVVLESPAKAVDGGDVAGTIQLASMEPGGYSLKTECSADAVLVLSEAWFPGWTVEVDGAPAELLRADHLLQAVRVPAGRHDVRFRYRSRFLGLGFALAAVGVVVPLGLILWRRRRP